MRISVTPLAEARRLLPITAGAALIILAAACGSARHGSAPAALGKGRAIFARSCAGCHTLTGHDTPAAGGDLAVAKLSPAAIASFARVMPARLTQTETKLVAAYIHAVAAHTPTR